MTSAIAAAGENAEISLKIDSSFNRYLASALTIVNPEILGKLPISRIESAIDDAYNQVKDGHVRCLSVSDLGLQGDCWLYFDEGKIKFQATLLLTTIGCPSQFKEKMKSDLIVSLEDKFRELGLSVEVSVVNQFELLASELLQQKFPAGVKLPDRLVTHSDIVAGLGGSLAEAERAVKDLELIAIATHQGPEEEGKLLVDLRLRSTFAWISSETARKKFDAYKAETVGTVLDESDRLIIENVGSLIDSGRKFWTEEASKLFPDILTAQFGEPAFVAAQLKVYKYAKNGAGSNSFDELVKPPRMPPVEE